VREGMSGLAMEVTSLRGLQRSGGQCSETAACGVGQRQSAATELGCEDTVSWPRFSERHRKNSPRVVSWWIIHPLLDLISSICFIKIIILTMIDESDTIGSLFIGNPSQFRFFWDVRGMDAVPKPTTALLSIFPFLT